MLILFVVLSAFALHEQDYQLLFTKWMGQHKKAYSSDDFFYRYTVFRQNLDGVIAENKKGYSYQLSMNHLGDLNHDEYKSLLGFKNVKKPFARSLNTASLPMFPLDDSKDWRALGKVAEIKDQGQCGSCWAFSAVASTESVNAIESGTLTTLSEQELVDCSRAQGNEGCNGGLMDNAFEYQKLAGGLASEKDYAYTARDGQCKASQYTHYAPIKGYVDIPQGNEQAVMAAVQKNPISVAIEADQFGFQFYSGGVFAASCGRNLDHGVALVGYGTDAGKNYWILRNSWGKRWGEQGYMRIIRDKDQCGLADAASYPTM